MTSETIKPPSKTRKLILQLVSGALTGGLVTFGTLSLLGDGGFDIDDPERVVALLTGLIFAIIGAMVGLGLVAPRVGSQLLNVEDADELREQARPLRTGALAMLFGGLGLVALAIAATGGEPGVLSLETGAILAGLAFAAATLMSVLNKGQSDELMRELGREASALSMSIVTVIALVWGTLAYAGYVPWVGPLGVVAGLFLVQLVAVFAVCAKRGLLMTR